jgi:colanic acid/amylovoran biosynthesis glycosyltransferase
VVTTGGTTAGADASELELERPTVLDVICVVSPEESEYSQTFVRAHLQELPARVKRLHSGYFPTRLGDGRHLLNPVERALTTLAPARLARGVRNRALARYLQRERVAVVLAEFGQTGVHVRAACQAAGVPLVVYFHGSDAFSDRWLAQYRTEYRELLESAAAVIAVSQEMMRHLERLGAPTARLFYNPCGADTTLFAGANPATAPPIFLAVGRFVDKKAPQLVLLAFAAVVEACPEARLTMIGDGPLLEACRQLVGALHISHAVELAGPCSHAEVAARMRLARGLIQHSVRTSYGDAEGTPVAVLEAGAAGLPVVATRHGGIPDVVVDEVTGLLVDEGDVRGMAERVVRLVREPELAATLGRAARQRVREQFALRQSIDTLWSILERTIRR